MHEGLGHAVALPHFIAPGLLERGFVSMFGLFLLLHLRVDELRRPGSAAHVGIGAFNLVRRDAYQSIGGHERLRFEVADDVKLGLVLRRSGVRQGCADSGGLVRVRWQRGFLPSMRGLLKNFFAGFDYGWVGTLRTALLVPLITTFPAIYLALAVGLSPLAGTRAVAAAAVAVPVVLLGGTSRRLAGGRWSDGLLLPFEGLCLALVALASALLATARGAVIWRGTRYQSPRAQGGRRARCRLAERSRAGLTPPPRAAECRAGRYARPTVLSQAGRLLTFDHQAATCGCSASLPAAGVAGRYSRYGAKQISASENWSPAR